MNDGYTREPEANVQVYNLGHYEQMQINIAIKEAIAKHDPAADSPLDVRCLASLDRLFQPFGTVTVIRTVD